MKIVTAMIRYLVKLISSANAYPTGNQCADSHYYYTLNYDNGSRVYDTCGPSILNTKIDACGSIHCIYCVLINNVNCVFSASETEGSVIRILEPESYKGWLQGEINWHVVY